MTLLPKDLFSALAHETRLRCLALLLRHPELCVCELTEIIGASQPHISRHLAQLREAGLVTDRRAGLWIYYRLNPAMPAWLEGVLRETRRGLEQQEPFASDAQAFSVQKQRSRNARCANGA